MCLKWTEAGRDQIIVGSNENLNWASGNGDKGMDGGDISVGESTELSTDWIWERERESQKEG